MSVRDDETLLRLYARSGDEAAFRELARRYGGLVYAACLREVRRPELAEDAAQAVFIDLARKAGRIRLKTSLVPWLYKAAKLAGRNVLRAERRRPTVPIDDSVPAPDLPSDVALFQALDALSAPEREAVVLRFLQGLSLAEVGEAQGVSEDAARMRVQRALQRLRIEYVPTLAAPFGLTNRLDLLSLPKPVPLMTPSLILATTGGLAAIAVAGSTFAHRPSSPPSALPTSVTIQPAQNRSQPAVQKPIPKATNVPTLDRPFTLTYHFVKRDLRSKAIRDQQAERYRRDLVPEVDADRMTPEQMEEAVAAMRQPQRVVEREIILSYDGKTLYVENLGGERQIFLVQKDRTFEFPQGMTGRLPSVSDRYSLFVARIPTLGVSLPYVPLVAGGKTLVAEGAPGRDGKPWYNPGRIESKNGKVTRIIQYAPGESRPYGITTLSDHRRIHRFAVAGTIAFRESTPEGPTESQDFQLTSASDRPLAADRFVPETYLPEKTDFFVTNRMRGRDFPYDRAKGPLDAQIREFLQGWQ